LKECPDPSILYSGELQITKAWGRTVSTEQAEAGWRAEVVQVLVKQLDGAYTPTIPS